MSETEIRLDKPKRSRGSGYIQSSIRAIQHDYLRLCSKADMRHKSIQFLEERSKLFNRCDGDHNCERRPSLFCQIGLKIGKKILPVFKNDDQIAKEIFVTNQINTKTEESSVVQDDFEYGYNLNEVETQKIIFKTQYVENNLRKRENKKRRITCEKNNNNYTNINDVENNRINIAKHKPEFKIDETITTILSEITSENRRCAQTLLKQPDV